MHFIWRIGECTTSLGNLMEIHVLYARVLSFPHPFQLEFDIDTALMPSTAHLTQSHAVISHQNRKLLSHLVYIMHSFYD